jgi:hypothetical protein
MSRAADKAERIQKAVADQQALKALRRKRKRLWPAYGLAFVLAPLVYWVGKDVLWMFYGTLWILLLGLDLLIGQRMYVHRAQRMEATIVAVGVLLIGFTVAFMLVLATRMILGL